MERPRAVGWELFNANEDKRLTQIGEQISLETREFQLFNKCLPVSQQQIDLNKNLIQTPGYN